MVKRGQSRHPGVVLLDPDHEHPNWRARYVDNTGKTRKVTLERVDAKTKETRLLWAKRLSEQLQRDRSDAKAGLLRSVEDLALSEAIKRYFTAHPRLAPRTRRAYEDAITTLAHGRERLTTGRLTAGVLVAWRTERSAVPKRVAKREGRRGEQRALSRLRSPHSVNRELRAAATILEFWRRAGLVKLSRDEIRDSLKREKATLERKSFLTPHQIRALLAAAASHDAATFTLNRKGERDALRYPAIAPLVRFLLLTGMRISEALAVEWSDVLDDRIHVRAVVSKTKQIRDVDLTVAPTALPPKHGKGRIFALSAGEARAAQRRVVTNFEWSPQALRRTCSTYFTNAFNAWRSAKSVGHSVIIAERHYAGLVKVAAGCETLEQAMGIAEM